MPKDVYAFEELSFSSQLIRDLINEDSKTRTFVNQFYDSSQIEDQIAEKKFDLKSRNCLVEALHNQNKDVKLSPISEDNIQLLQEANTYTITTGHQLNLMGGPLYSIYKIAQTIKISQELKTQNPAYNFVPVFWMATEDHDFDEINHFHLFNQKMEWLKEGQENCIAGRIKLDELSSLLTALEDKFSDESARSLVNEFTEIYRKSANLARATKGIINKLFGDFGLIIIDGDDPLLKTQFKKLATAEIKDELTFGQVAITNTKLQEAGYHNQVYVRECNLFYIEKNGERVRIKKEAGEFEIKKEKFSTEQLLKVVDEHPENFSPNALMRPLYQENVLPNLVYVGGGGEIAYWMQIKGVFEKLDLTYPMLRVRDSILLANKKQLALMEEYDLELMDLKLGVDSLIKEMAIEKGNEDLDLSEAKEQIGLVKTNIKKKASKIGAGLDGMIEAEFVKFLKSIDRIESKLIKAEKTKFEQVEKKLNRLSQQFFPNGGFQERYDNFLPQYLKSSNFVNQIVTNLSADKKPVIRILLND